MTHAYVKVQRAGVWDRVEIEQLTDAELDDLRARSEAGGAALAAEEGWAYAKFLAGWIRDNVQPPQYVD